MAISGPYVHSNYSNFYSQVTRGLGFEREKSLPKVMNEITTQLHELKVQLYNATKGALGRLTVDDLNDYFFNPKKTLLGVAWKVLQDPSIEKQMINVLTEDAWEIDQNKLGESLAREIFNSLTSEKEEEGIGFNFYDYATKVAAAALNNKGKDENGNQQKVNRGDIYTTFNITSSSKSTSKGLTRGSVNQKYIGKVVRDILKEEGIAKEKKVANSQRGERLFEIFEPAFRKGLKQGPSDKENVESFLKAVRSYFNKASTSLIAGTRSVASGDITEKIGFLITEAYTTIAGANATTVVQMNFIGDMSEKNVRENLKGSFKAGLENWHSLDKQSYSDFILYIGEKPIRVQAKNYLGIQEAILNKDDRLMQLNALGSAKSLEEFMGLINSSATRVTKIPKEELKYIMANEIWFQLAGSWIGGKDKSGSTKTERIQQRGYGSTILDTFLSNSLMAYIGVQLDGTEVVPELSNLFYLVNNMKLVPTYTIVEQILEGFKNFEKSATKLRVKIGSTNVTADAQGYYESKQEAANAAGTHLIRGENYNEAWLVSLGTAQGEKILSDTTIETSNIDLGLA